MIIHTALFAEAKEIINFFKLKKYEDKNFLIFSNKNIVLIVSGIGKINAAMTLSHILTLYPEKKEIVNIGIAAGKDRFNIGELVNIKKIIDLEEKKVFHLKKIYGIKNLTLCTSLYPQTNPKADIGDMEGSAIYQVAKKYKKDLTIFKIISDSFNPQSIEKESVDKLILKNINLINQFITNKKISQK